MEAKESVRKELYLWKNVKMVKRNEMNENRLGIVVMTIFWNKMY